MEEKRKQFLDELLETPNGLSNDAINAWMFLAYYYQNSKHLGRIPDKEILHYATYNEQAYPNNEDAQYLNEKSSRDAITQFDFLVDMYNKNREEIIEKNDLYTIKLFYNEADELVRGLRPLK